MKACAFQTYSGKKTQKRVFSLCSLKSYFDKLKGTDQAGTFMSLKCVVYYANYRSWHQSSNIQVVS